jgi:predicted phage terminase large subunit-like protein
MTRLTPDARAVMICTRWHERDPAHWAIEQGWHVIHIPALDAEGESYWPERWPSERLSCRSEHRDPPRCCEKARFGTRLFNLMYQGQVIDDEHAIFKRAWWRRYRREDIAFEYQTGKLRAARFVDTAATTNDASDYTVIATWLTDGTRGYLWEIQRGRWTFPEQVQRLTVEDQTLKNIPTYIEEVPWTLPLIQTVRAIIPGVIGWRIDQRVRAGERAKQARAEAASPFAEAGNLYLPFEAPWVDPFIEECAAFPGGAHDDQVDTLSMFALEMLAKQQLMVVSR